MSTAPKTPKNGPEKPHHLGHRERLKQRFADSGGEGLADYEILELLLMQFIPRRDVKPAAKYLLKKAGALHKVMDMPPHQIAEAPGIGDKTAFVFSVLKTFNMRAKREAVLKKPAFLNKLDLLAYLYDKMTPLQHEEFHVIYLNSKNYVLAEEMLFRGTIDTSVVYPREVIKTALEKGARSLVLVHNHPSGDPTPSQDDFHLTAEIQKLATPMGIHIEDHIIIGDGIHYSFLDQGKL